MKLSTPSCLWLAAVAAFASGPLAAQPKAGGGRLSQSCRQDHPAAARGGRHRRRRARGSAETHGSVGPAGHRGQSSGRERHHRQRGGREIEARRLHAPLWFRLAAFDQFFDLQVAAVRHPARFHPHHPDGHEPDRAGRQSAPAGAVGEGAGALWRARGPASCSSARSGSGTRPTSPASCSGSRRSSRCCTSRTRARRPRSRSWWPARSR